MKKYIIASALVLPLTLLAATYITQRGDTLQTVAKKTGMTVEQLAKSNPNLRVTSNQVIQYDGTSVPSTPIVPTTPNSNESKFKSYVTFYSFWDNTPPGTADISHPVIHSKAGGTGTFNDPITLAVGHSIVNGKDILDTPAGTKFYFYSRYWIVEDTCGDGNTPQNGPCHKGYPSDAKMWIDGYADGKNTTKSKANQCMENLTGVVEVIQNPTNNYAVDISPICK